MPKLLLLLVLVSGARVFGIEVETLPPLVDGQAPSNLTEMWSGFDPRAEPLEVETMREWQEDGVTLRIVRFRVGVFKGQKSMLAAVYGFPTDAAERGEKIPGLVQIHGGGQFADHRACLANGKRGYATISLAWAGRISAPEYTVNSDVVKLYWDGETEDPRYRITTDWGAVDGYHAPSRNDGNQFPSANAHPWTIDEVESPRNSSWFLCALAARRALTFLERQPEVDAARLGVYGHSMGGKLTVLASVDGRVKAAAPSCGGISDRYNASELFRNTLGDDVSLQAITCPIIFLSPANDFHGRIGDLPRAMDEIQSSQWAVTCSPHGSHQDTAEYEVATLLWFDEHLKGTFQVPNTPVTGLTLMGPNGIPTFSVQPDTSLPVLAVDIFYTLDGKATETNLDRINTKNRLWRHATATRTGDTWIAPLPINNTDKPLWVYANVAYELAEPVSGAGYYYRIYEAETFNVSSLLVKATAEELKMAGVQPSLQPSLMIERFEGDWEKEWFTYKPDAWPRATHKIHDEQWHAPENASLAIAVRSQEDNRLVILLDDRFAAVVELKGSKEWQNIDLDLSDFRALGGESPDSWVGIGELKLSDAERLKPSRGETRKPEVVGRAWRGSDPEFRNLRWVK